MSASPLRSPYAWTLLLAAMLLLDEAPAFAGNYLVPSGATPTLQSAVNAAAVSGDAVNLINLGGTPVFTGAVVTIGNAFHSGHTLTIRPVTSMSRAIIASQNGSQRIFDLVTAGSVRFQDLDIVRYSTNNNDLIYMDMCTDILMERCRIGSIWTSVGTAGPWRNIAISYPINVTLRNCIVFSYMFGNFDRAISASLADDTNSLFLYNNDVSDYSEYGIEVSAHLAGQVVALTNNIVMNHPDAGVEPVAYHSVVDAVVTLSTSHNVAFAGVANVERLDDDQLISGASHPEFERLPRDLVDETFVATAWNPAAGWNLDAERDFYRLRPAGKLHNELNDFGKNEPTVMDDWERNARPSGPIPQHTDRGADQVEIGTVGVEPSVAEAGLWAAPVRSPARDVGVRFHTGFAGRLEFEVFDVAGRMLHRETRDVAGGTDGVFSWEGPRRGQVLQYRLRLTGDGAAVQQTGRTVVLQ